MIGPRAAALLRRRARAWTRRSLLRSLALWAALALGASNLASAAGLLGLLDEAAYNILLIVLLSTFPGALFYPPDPRSGMLELRAADREAVLESALAAAPGEAAEPLLRSRGEGLAALADRAGRPRTRLSRGERILYAAAAAAVFAAQASSLLIAGRPALGFAAAPPRPGQAAEGTEGFSRPGESRPEEDELFDPGEGPEGPESDRAENPAERALREAEFADLHGLVREDREGTAAEPREGEPSADEEGGPAEPGASAAGPSGAGGDRVGPEAEPGTDPSGSRSAGNPDEASRSGTPDRSPQPGSGWSDAPGAAGRSAMKDYRAAFEKVYSGRTRAAVTAGTDLALSDLEDAFRRYFESLRLSAGVDPEDDPVVSGLRAAWLRIRGGLE